MMTRLPDSWLVHTGVLLLGLALTGCGCGGEDDDGGAAPASGGSAGGGAQATTQALSIESETGCAVNADCAAGLYCFQNRCAYDCVADEDCLDDEVCTARGSCVKASEMTAAPASSAGAAGTAPVVDLPDPAVAESLPLNLVGPPQTVFRVPAGQREVVLRLVLDGTVPAEGLAYTVERTDEEEWNGRVLRAFGDSSVDIPLLTGRADPALGEEATTVQATVSTAVGTFSVALIPAAAVTGRYVGEANVSIFGSVGLPMELSIVTQPKDATLETAEQAWLLIDVADSNLFSPVEQYAGAPEYIATELVYDDFVSRWVARFENEFRFSSANILPAGDPGQIGRILRFEVETNDDGALVGQFSDRWEGLYDARSAEGLVELVDVLFEGNVDLKRVGAGVSLADMLPPPGDDPASPWLVPPPPIDQCAGVAFLADPVTIGADPTEYSCGAMADPTDFGRATPDEQALCAVRMAEAALASGTTTEAIAAFLDDQVANPGGMSFSEFMEQCASGTDGTCVPTPEVLCARQLLANAYRNQQQDSATTAQLVQSYGTVAREAFLGRQLAAFKTDADKRLEWLSTTDYPAIVTNAVRSTVSQLLDEWQTGVLDVHMSVLEGYVDPSGLAVMSRASNDAAANEARRRLLSEMVLSWRGAMEGLVVATQRWDELFEDAADRQEKSDYVTTRMFDLYLSAGMLANLSRDAGTGYMATAFGSGFSNLMRRQGRLSLSFDDLVFARDAEVVISTSLDPGSSSETILERMSTDAEAEITRASESVQGVLAAAQEAALTETQLQNRMSNEINDLRSELVELCGLPTGCQIEDFRADADCEVRTRPGECGFTIARDTGDYDGFTQGEQSTSEAGRVLLRYLDAAQNVRIAAAELQAHQNKADLDLEALEAFVADVEMWNERRLEGADELAILFDQQNLIGAQGLGELARNLRDRSRTRAQQIASQRSNIQSWNRIRVAGATTDFAGRMGISALDLVANQLDDTADFTLNASAAAAEAAPEVGVSIGTDTSVEISTAVAKTGILLAGAAAAYGMQSAANFVGFAAAALDNALQLNQDLREARLDNLAEAAALEEAITEADLAALEEQLELNDALRADEIDALQQGYDLATAQREAELAYFRDLDEVRQRRTALLKMLQDRAELVLRLERAKLGVEARMAEYAQVVQRAQLQHARLLDLEQQRADVNQLVGSPGVIFSRANQLTQAENRLQRAKDKLMDYLVALEYFAVRPFIDQRLQILLAVNPYQLEEILNELARLEANCGGAVNTGSAEISVRADLLHASFEVEDVVAQTNLSAEERFRQILAQGYVPIDKRVRYTTDSTIGDLMQSPDRVLAGTFDINLNHFANLAATCNAKVASLSVQLVGDLGDARPTVTVLYDGTSRLRSCQPDIEDYVELIGRNRTNFGEITLLRTPGRSVSPVAGIGEWLDEESANTSLGGLPLASQYTVLIDKELGENSRLSWDALEDILLRIEYVYSDVYPSGQCE